MSSTTNNTYLQGTATLDPNDTIPSTPQSGNLPNNTWGYHTGATGNGSFNPIPPSSNPTTIIDINNELPYATHPVTYGVRIDNLATKPSRTYTANIKYTLTAKLPPAPTITNVTPNTYEIGSEQSNPGANKLTITGTNLQTTQEVYIDSNNNNQPDNGEHCTNLTITNNTTVSCTIPTNLNPGKYNVILTTQGGTTIPNTNSTITYIKPSICRAGAPDNDCQVDIDSNMIPINYTSDGNFEIVENQYHWYNYNNKQWANAITVKNDAGYGINSYCKDTRTNEYATIALGQACTRFSGSYTDNTALQFALDVSNGRASAGSVELKSDDILGYWVYVPRYAYEVQRPNATDKYVTAQNFDIRFEKATDTKKTPADTCNILNPTKEQMWANGTPSSSESNILAKDYRTQCNIDRTYPGNDTTKANKTTWATHPAFTWKNSTGSINKELNGIWVGKFETTGKRSAPTIKPNQHANINESIGEFYNAAKSMGKADPNNTGGGANTDDTTSNLTQNSHNMATATTHMLKNSEWGAIAYLSASKYGAGVNNVDINSAYPSTSADADGDRSRSGITGCGYGTGDYPKDPYTDGTPLDATTIESETACSKSTDRSYTSPIGQLASTTNNIYGVYDMSGGTYEYVMGNRTTNATQTTSSTSYFKTPTSEPYVDLYKTTDIDTPFGTKPAWSSSTSEYYYNFDACTWLTCGGHALHETKTVQSVSSGTQSWGSDYSNFVDSSSPWFRRGYYADVMNSVGIFASNYDRGSRDGNNGYRVVSVVN